MNEKLTRQGLAGTLAEKNKIQKESTDIFVKEFFQLIKDGLKKDKYVKINGLGTFKVINIEPRESINVNTKERFQIEGHQKTAFTPDAELKEIINLPFANFETVILNSNISPDDLTKISNDKTTDKENVIEEDDETIKADDEEIVEESEKTEVITTANTETSPNKKNIEQNTEEIKKEPEQNTDSDIVVPNSPSIDNTQDKIYTETTDESKESETIVTSNIEISSDKKIVEQKAEEIKKESEQSTSKVLTPEEIIAKELISIPLSQQSIYTSVKTKSEPKEIKSKKTMVTIIVIIILMLAVGGVLLYWTMNPIPSTSNPQINNQSKPTSTIDTLAAPDFNAKHSQDSLSTAEKIDKNTKNSNVTYAERAIDLAEKKNKKKNKTVVIDKKQPEKKAATAAVSAKKQIKTNQTGKLKIVGLKTTHILQKGETLYMIAKKYLGSKSKITYLIQYNHFKNPDNVQIGKKIKIPELSE